MSDLRKFSRKFLSSGSFSICYNFFDFFRGSCDSFDLTCSDKDVYQVINKIPRPLHIQMLNPSEIFFIFRKNVFKERQQFLSKAIKNNELFSLSLPFHAMPCLKDKRNS